MKILNDFTRNEFEEHHLDAPRSVNNIKLMLLDTYRDFSDPEVQRLFRVPKDNYPGFEKWYHNKLTKDSIDTINNSSHIHKNSDHIEDFCLFNKNNNNKRFLNYNLLNGRLALVASVDDNLAGVTVLKKDDSENKISTFFIEDKYGKMGLATLLLNASMLILGSTPVDITVSENNVDKLYPFLIKNGFKEFLSIDGQYKKNKKEIHFKKF